MAKLNLKDQIKITAKPLFNNGLLNNENIKKKIVIIKELKDLIKPLQVEEFEQLKANILQNGCQDTIKIWHTSEQIVNPEAESNEEMFVLIDGHNRYKICTENEVSFNITLMSFDTLEDVKAFMIDLQLGRRNVSLLEVSYYRGLQYNNTKNAESKATNFSKKDESQKTSELMGEKFGVDEKTIRRDGDFAKGLEALSQDLKDDILTGKAKISKKEVMQLGRLEIDNPIKSVEEIVSIVKDAPPLEQYNEGIRDIKPIKKEHQQSAKQKLGAFLNVPNRDNFEELKKLIKGFDKLVIS
jgi:hypothetical protein